MKKYLAIAALAASVSANASEPINGVTLYVVYEDGVADELAEFRGRTTGLVKRQKSTDYNYHACLEAAGRMSAYKFGRNAYFECRINYGG